MLTVTDTDQVVEHIDDTAVDVDTAHPPSDPWCDPVIFGQLLAEHIPYDTGALAILSDEQPQVDELLVADGFSQAGLSRWLRNEFDRDGLVASARKKGLAVSKARSAGQSRLARQCGHLLLAMQSTGTQPRHSWCLMVGRKGHVFTAYEQDTAALLLRCWQSSFERPVERGMGRVIVGHDKRLIHLDPFTELQFLQNSGMQEQLLGLIDPVIEQRWPDLKDDQVHDFVVELAEHLTWIRFCRRRPIDTDAATQWQLELRPLPDEELPPMGEVENSRVAQALAYLHDHFKRTPRLEQMAAVVHVSTFHFHRLFGTSVGISPKRYLQRWQLQIAKWLLTTSQCPIGDIAAEAGFKSHGHFTSTFHKIVGLSPSQYRDEHGRRPFARRIGQQ